MVYPLLFDPHLKRCSEYRWKEFIFSNIHILRLVKPKLTFVLVWADATTLASHLRKGACIVDIRRWNFVMHQNKSWGAAKTKKADLLIWKRLASQTPTKSCIRSCQTSVPKCWYLLFTFKTIAPNWILQKKVRPRRLLTYYDSVTAVSWVIRMPTVKNQTVVGVWVSLT